MLQTGYAPKTLQKAGFPILRYDCLVYFSQILKSMLDNEAELFQDVTVKIEFLSNFYLNLSNFSRVNPVFLSMGF